MVAALTNDTQNRQRGEGRGEEGEEWIEIRGGREGKIQVAWGKDVEKDVEGDRKNK